MDIRKAPEFDRWFAKLRLSEQMQITARLYRNNLKNRVLSAPASRLFKAAVSLISLDMSCFAVLKPRAPTLTKSDFSSCFGISRIENECHFGDAKILGDRLAELRWKNGRRIYFTRIGNKIVILLLGGIKNGQKKDIKKARLLLRTLAKIVHEATAA